MNVKRVVMRVEEDAVAIVKARRKLANTYFKTNIVRPMIMDSFAHGNSIPMQTSIMKEVERKAFFKENGYSKVGSDFDLQRTVPITYPGVECGRYFIDTSGYIFDSYTKTVKEATIEQNRYATIYLRSVTGLSVKYGLHRLVAYAFCNPPTNYNDYTVNHIDLDTTNNHYSNLEWISSGDNIRHSHNVYQPRVIDRPPVSAPLVHKICKLMEEGLTDVEVINALGMNTSNANFKLAYDIRKGNTWAYISKNYNIRSNSKFHVYEPEDIKKIEDCIINGDTDKVIFKKMVGRDYVSAKDRTTPEYRGIGTVRARLNRNHVIENTHSEKMDASFVHEVCKLLEKGKSTNAVLDAMGLPRDNANRKYISRIRNGQVFKDIVSQYHIEKIEMRRMTDEQKYQAKLLAMKGMRPSDIFTQVIGRQYTPADHGGSYYDAIRRIYRKYN